MHSNRSDLRIVTHTPRDSQSRPLVDVLTDDAKLAVLVSLLMLVTLCGLAWTLVGVRS